MMFRYNNNSIDSILFACYRCNSLLSPLEPVQQLCRGRHDVKLVVSFHPRNESTRRKTDGTIILYLQMVCWSYGCERAKQFQRRFYDYSMKWNDFTSFLLHFFEGMVTCALHKFIKIILNVLNWCPMLYYAVQNEYRKWSGLSYSHFCSRDRTWM